MNKLKLRVFQDEDVKLFASWLNQDYIRKWYQEPDEWLGEVEGRHDKFCWINHFLVTHHDKPIGFCQFYEYKNSGETWHGDIPVKGTYSIDYLIGDKEYLRKGYGSQIVDLITEEIFLLERAKRIIVQPEKNNIASCNTLLSRGYTFDEKNQLFMKGRS